MPSASSVRLTNCKVRVAPAMQNGNGYCARWGQEAGGHVKMKSRCARGCKRSATRRGLCNGLRRRSSSGVGPVYSTKPLLGKQACCIGLRNQLRSGGPDQMPRARGTLKTPCMPQQTFKLSGQQNGRLTALYNQRTNLGKLAQWNPCRR